MESGSDRRFVGGALPFEPIGPESFSEFSKRWDADPVWRSTLVPPGVEFADCAEAHDWPLRDLRSRRQPGPLQVKHELPAHFEAYVRVLCPFVGAEVGEDGQVVGQELVDWHDTALRNDRVPHRLMDVVGVGPDHRDTLHGGHQPYQGLHPDQATALFEVLQSHTTSDRGWFLLWDGDYHGSLVLPEGSKVELPGAGMYFCLFQGTLSAWDGFWTLPRWWWPADRAWCFQTNIDLDMTNCIYVGGASTCIEAILASPIIEALVAHPDDAVIGQDTVNRPGRT